MSAKIKKQRRVRCVSCGVLQPREKMRTARDSGKWACKDFSQCFARFHAQNSYMGGES